MTTQILQYLINEEGQKTAVIVPIKDWDNLQEKLKELVEYQIAQANLKQAVKKLENKLRIKENKKRIQARFIYHKGPTPQ
jgi:PHD/YefM family antitoxin component YafN of YafNO toxin-antitoxin module